MRFASCDAPQSTATAMGEYLYPHPHLYLHQHLLLHPYLYLCICKYICGLMEDVNGELTQMKVDYFLYDSIYCVRERVLREGKSLPCEGGCIAAEAGARFFLGTGDAWRRNALVKSSQKRTRRCKYAALKAQQFT